VVSNDLFVADGMPSSAVTVEALDADGHMLATVETAGSVDECHLSPHQDVRRWRRCPDVKRGRLRQRFTLVGRRPAKVVAIRL
jgi:hypothetical protein